MINENEVMRKRAIIDEVKPEPKKVIEDKPKKLSKKDQLVNYVKDLKFKEETEKALFKWIWNVGIGKGLTVDKLGDKLEKLDKECNGNEDLMREAFENAYMNSYLVFVAPKATQTTTKVKSYLDISDVYREDVKQREAASQNSNVKIKPGSYYGYVPGAATEKYKNAPTEILRDKNGRQVEVLKDVFF